MLLVVTNRLKSQTACTRKTCAHTIAAVEWWCIHGSWKWVTGGATDSVAPLIASDVFVLVLAAEIHGRQARRGDYICLVGYFFIPVLHSHRSGCAENNLSSVKLKFIARRLLPVTFCSPRLSQSARFAISLQAQYIPTDGFKLIFIARAYAPFTQAAHTKTCAGRDAKMEKVILLLFNFVFCFIETHFPTSGFEVYS